MGPEQRDARRIKKKSSATDRPLTTALYILRCVQLGLSMADLEYLTLGMVLDMFTERANDECPGAYGRKATQEDMNQF